MAKKIQFLRNSNLVTTQELAKTALNELLTATTVDDGSIYLARYGTSDDDAKTLVGVSYVSGDNKTMTVLNDTSAVEGNVTALQSELDATQVGAGLESDGRYTAPSGSNYLNAVSSLKAADVELDKQLGTLSGNVTTISGNVSTISGNVETLSGNVSTISGSVETLSDTVDTINTEVETLTTNLEVLSGNALTGLTAGTGISISGDGNTRTISANLTTSNISIAYSSDDKKIYLYGNDKTTTGNALSFIDATDFIKDGMLQSVEIATLSEGTESNPQNLEDGKYLHFVFNTEAEQEDIYINLNTIVTAYTAGDGLSLSASNQFSVKLSSDNESTYLNIGTDGGLKLSGITTISNKATANETKITNIISGSGLNSDTGAYVPNTGSSIAYISGATSLNDADVKLDAAIKAFYTKYEATQNELNNTQIGAGLNADGSYSAYSSSEVNYISSAESLKEADKLLDNKIKNVEDKVTNLTTTVDGKISAVTVNNVAASVSSGKATVTIGPSNINMTSYVKDTSAKTIATGDTLNVAIGKLEYKCDAYKPVESSNIKVSTTNTGTTLDLGDNAVWDCGTYSIE